MPTSYTIEHAKSGRSSCKTKACGQKIDKGELRIGSSAPGPGDYDIVKWYHVECFPFPRKLKSEGETCQTFVETILEDNTDEGILNDEEKAAEIIALLEQKGCRKKVDAETGESPPQGASDVIAKIKRTAELIAQEDDEDSPKSKKVKTETEISETDRAKAEIFAVLSSKKVDELKDVLRWNKQIVGGNKDTLLARIVDAKLHGRLGRCPSCLRGRVKLTEEDGGATVFCSGWFDEELQIRHSCFYKAPAAQAPRLQPFYMEEPTEEEKEEMEGQWEAAKAGSAEAVAAGEDGMSVVSKLVSGIEDFDLSSPPGIQKAAVDLVAALSGIVDIPDDERKARMEIGKIVMMNKTSSKEKILQVIIDQFGLKAVNEEQSKAKAKSATSVCGHPANAPVLEAIMELSSLYFKEGNANAGGSYKKVANAIKDLDYEITADNAKGLGKGKTKVGGIGKGSSEKIHEFLETGKMAKLEEKRAGQV